jgi:N-acyl homoserine lactone hydrolase
MTRIETIQRILLPSLTALAFCLTLGCAASHHPTRVGSLGEPASAAKMEALLSTPGPIGFERVAAADWEVARSGMINLDHPRAKAAGLRDGPEAIGVYFYVLEAEGFSERRRMVMLK